MKLRIDPVIKRIANIYQDKIPKTVKEVTKRHINQESLKLITRISDDQRIRIMDLLRQGEEKGRSIAATASTLLKTGLDRGIFKSARRRAYLIARTELHRARQKAAIDIFKAADIKVLHWVGIPEDGRICRECLSLHGKTYHIDDIKESDYPPKHPRCRCRILPHNLQLNIIPKTTKMGKEIELKITPVQYKYVVKLGKLKKSSNNLEKAEIPVKGFTRMRRGRYELVRPYHRSVIYFGEKPVPVKRERGDEPFYSVLEKLVNEKFPTAMPGNQLKAFLVNHGIKEEEIKWTKIYQLFSHPRITKQEIADYVDKNRVKLVEIVKGKDDVAIGIEERTSGEVGTKFGSYKLKLEGGKNYKELLFIWDKPQQFKSFKEFVLSRGFSEEEFDKYVYKKMGPVAKVSAELHSAWEEHSIKEPTYESSHWEERNVLLHTRFQEFEDTEGSKILNIEEVQSDWHQEGKKRGYRTPVDFYPEVVQQYAGSPQGVPPAPFSKTWHELGMRRMLHMAVEGGFDKLSWTTGEQQADRYDLSKVINKIYYKKESENRYTLNIIYKNYGSKEIITSGDKLEEHVGKEIAQKIIKSEGEREDEWGKVLRGLDLKIGGEGMKGFYDKILVDYMNKLGKQYGVKVENTELVGSSRNYVFYGGEKTLEEVKKIRKKALREYKRDIANNLKDIELLMTGHILGSPVSYKEAVLRLYLESFHPQVEEGSKDWIDYLGGDIRWEKKKHIVHSLEITPKMQQDYMQGTPLFKSEDDEIDLKKAEYEHSSTQVELPKNVAKDLTKFLEESIDPNDLYPKDMDILHITIRYGLHTDDIRDVSALLALNEIEASIIGIDFFELDDYDVLISRVDSPELNKLNEDLGELEHTDNFPYYQPHLTLAYLKKGTGKKYLNLLTGLEGKTFIFDKIIFSKRSGDKSTIDLTKARMHKYIRREGAPGKYVYFYEEPKIESKLISALGKITPKFDIKTTGRDDWDKYIQNNPDEIKIEMRMMSPDEFLEITDTKRYTINEKNVAIYIKTINSDSILSIPTIIYDSYNKKEKSDFHDGSHRVLALKELGVTSIPVLEIFKAKLEISKSLEKARPYVRTRRGKLERVKGYTGRLRLDLPEQIIDKAWDRSRKDVQFANSIVNEVRAEGGHALIVGGFIRDALLGKPSKDIDIEVYGIRPDKLRILLEKFEPFEKFVKPYYEEKPALTKEEIKKINEAWGHPKKWKKLEKEYSGLYGGKDIRGLAREYKSTGKIPISRSISLEKYQELYSKWKETQKKVDSVGASFGVFKVSNPELSEPIDVSVPRRDSKIGEGHRGFEVEPDPMMTVEEAARRRDLTINSISYDPITNELIDPYNGLQDIKDRKLRAVDPQTFIEDPLRVMRVMQFAARFGMTPDLNLIKICRGTELSSLPRERIYGEFEKLLLKSKSPSIGLRLIPILGINKILPELDTLRGSQQDPEWHREGSVWVHTLGVVDAAANIRKVFTSKKDKMIFMLSALLHDIAKPQTLATREDGRLTNIGHAELGAGEAVKFLNKFTTEIDVIEGVEKLVKYHLLPSQFYDAKVGDSAIRRLAKKVNIPMLTLLSMADKLGTGLKLDLSAEKWLLERYKNLKLDKLETLSPKVKGRHLLPLGIEPGPRMGEILDKIYEGQLEGKFETTEQGIEYAREQGLIQKAQLHKYIKREGTPGKYIYFYQEEKGKEKITVPGITRKDLDKLLEYRYLVSDEKILANTLDEYWDHPDTKKLIAVKNQVFEDIKKKLQGIHYEEKDLKRRLLLTNLEVTDFAGHFPVIVYVSSHSEDKMTIGLELHQDGHFEMFEGNEEATPETLDLVNKLLGVGEKKIKVWSNQPSEIAEKIRAGVIPKGIFVSPKRDVAEAYWGEGRELVSFEIPLKNLSQISEIDWQVREPVKREIEGPEGTYEYRLATGKIAQLEKKTTVEEFIFKKLGLKLEIEQFDPANIYAKTLGQKSSFIGKDNKIVVWMDESSNQILLNTIKVEKERIGLGTQFINQLKEYSDITGKKLVVLNPTLLAQKFLNKFKWLKVGYHKDANGKGMASLEYTPTKKKESRGETATKDFPFKVLTPEGDSLGNFKTREEAESVIYYAAGKFPDMKYKKSFKIIPSEPSDFEITKAARGEIIEKSFNSIKKSAGARLVLDRNKAKYLISRIKKSREKTILYRDNGKIVWAKTSPYGLLIERKANKGEDILIKGMIAEVIAVGKDGITAKDNNGNKYNIFHNETVIVKQRSNNNFEKARLHKYIRRKGTKGEYIYTYEESKPKVAELKIVEIGEKPRTNFQKQYARKVEFEGKSIWQFPGRYGDKSREIEIPKSIRIGTGIKPNENELTKIQGAFNASKSEFNYVHIQDLVDLTGFPKEQVYQNLVYLIKNQRAMISVNRMGHAVYVKIL